MSVRMDCYHLHARSCPSVGDFGWAYIRRARHLRAGTASVGVCVVSVPRQGILNPFSLNGARVLSLATLRAVSSPMPGRR